MRAEFRRENAHKAGQHHQVGLISIDFLHHGLIEFEAAAECFVLEAVGGDAARSCPSQPGGIGAVAQHRRDAGIGNSGFYNGLHIAAAAGNQDNDVFHSGLCCADRGKISIYFAENKAFSRI